MELKTTNLSNTPTPFNPQVIITIAVDCAFVYTQNTGLMQTGQGIYMFDNQVTSGSTQEGGLELITNVPNPMEFIGFNIYDINFGTFGANVTIEGFQVSGGTNIFTGNGMPSPQTATSSTCQWMGEAMQQTNNDQPPMIYQIKIGISYPNQPIKYYWWDPFMVCA